MHAGILREPAFGRCFAASPNLTLVSCAAFGPLGIIRNGQRRHSRSQFLSSQGAVSEVQRSSGSLAYRVTPPRLSDIESRRSSAS